MRKILIIGCGGQGRETQWLIDRINQKNPTWQIEGYLDDGVLAGTHINEYQVLGGIKTLEMYNEKETALVCAIASSKEREILTKRVKNIGEFKFPNLIEPSVLMNDYVTMGEGNIICANTLLSVNITIGDFVFIDWDCKIGHDAVLNSFVTLHSSVNVSGDVTVKGGTEIGIGTQITQGKTIGEGSTVEAGSVVLQDIPPSCVAVGAPAKPVKFLNADT